MKNLLEDLWYSYQMNKPVQMDDEKKKREEVLSERMEKLCADLSNEQQKALYQYEDAMNGLNCIYEKDAFIAGIRFAVSFLTEALCGSPE